MMFRMKLKSSKIKTRLRKSIQIDPAKNSDSPDSIPMSNINLHRAYSNLTPKKSPRTFDNLALNMTESIKLSEDEFCQ
jgi:hypothetical protein